METPKVKCRPCAIDFAGNVWNQREYGDRDTPATAIPDEVLADARNRLNWIIDYSYDDHAKGAARVALSLLGDTP